MGVCASESNGFYQHALASGNTQKIWPHTHTSTNTHYYYYYYSYYYSYKCCESCDLTKV